MRRAESRTPRPLDRPLRLVDATLMIAAAAAGLAAYLFISRAILPQGPTTWARLTAPPSGDRGWTAGQVVVRVIESIAPSLPFAASWTLALPLIDRLGRRRSAARRRRTAPGDAACLAAILGMAWATDGLGEGVAALRATGGTSTGDGCLFLFVVEQAFPDVGLAVAATWFGLWVSGRWRAAPNWVDRSGRALGAYWIVVGLIWAPREYLNALPYRSARLSVWMGCPYDECPAEGCRDRISELDETDL